MLKGLGQLLLGDRRTDKRACRQQARGAGKPESFQWCAPALGDARRRAVAAPGPESPKTRPAGRREKAGFPHARAEWGPSPGALFLHPSRQNSCPRAPLSRASGRRGVPQPRALSALCRAWRPPPHSSAAPPPDLLLILARALETPGRPKCAQVCVASGEGMTTLY